VKMSYRR